MSYELHEHDSGFRATVPTPPGVLARLSGMKAGRFASALDVAVMMGVMLPAAMVASGLPAHTENGIMGAGFVVAMALSLALRRRVERGSTRILDVDRGQVRVADSTGRVLFSAPLEQVRVRLSDGLRLQGPSGTVCLQSAESLGSLVDRLHRSQAAHGTRGDVPGQLEALLER